MSERGPERKRTLASRTVEARVSLASFLVLCCAFSGCGRPPAGTASGSGFEAIGEPFEVEGIGPHVVMWRELPRVMASGG